MIPRHQTIFFIVLFIASAIMGGVLWHLRDRAHKRLLTGQESSPTHAPLVAPVEQVTLQVARDSDNSLQIRLLSLPLPPDSDARARAVLGKLLDLYAASDASHPVPGGANSIAQVFLLPVSNTAAKPGAAAVSTVQSGPELAVVNFTNAFATNHPSGLETENLTVLSICATLHANLPRITQVRFLVDGHPRATLAGHADLTRTYLAGDNETTEGGRP